MGIETAMKSRLPKTLAISELVQLLGISRQAIATHVASGVIVKTGPNSYDIKSVPAYCAHLRQLAADAGEELTPERVRFTRAKASREELRLAEMQGELVHVGSVVEEVSLVFVNIKQHLRGLPSKLAVPLHACPDARAVQVLLQAQIDQALEELSSTPDTEEEAA
jgi:phage terminase Nu1 subunit (DNA packaging protein)